MKHFKNSRTNEELNRLCLKIKNDFSNQISKTILVLSCNEGEGTSTIAVNLSRIFSQEINSTTLLINANLRNYELDKVFKLKKMPGLTDLISNDIEFRDAIKKSAIENLYILNAGKRVSNPKTILDSRALGQYIEKFKKHYQFIIIDSAPIIPYSDSLIVASKVDIVLLIIEAEKTRWEVAQEAVKKLSAAGVEVFGIILNKKRYYIPNILYKRL